MFGQGLSSASVAKKKNGWEETKPLVIRCRAALAARDSTKRVVRDDVVSPNKRLVG